MRAESDGSIRARTRERDRCGISLGHMRCDRWGNTACGLGRLSRVSFHTPSIVNTSKLERELERGASPSGSKRPGRGSRSGLSKQLGALELPRPGLTPRLVTLRHGWRPLGPPTWRGSEERPKSACDLDLSLMVDRFVG